MVSSFVKDLPEALPEGYAAVPLGPDQCVAPLRLCVLVKEQADPVAGHLVVLRDTADARVLLGGVVDAGGQVHQWVELWVQTCARAGRTPLAWRGPLTNAELDARWERRYQALRELDPVQVLETGWEKRHPPPLFIDVADLRPLYPQEGKAGQTWQLCRDDAVLSAHGLPPYETSLHRYLYLPKAPAPAFVPVTPDAPTNDHTRPLAQALGGQPRPDLVAVNPEGGLVMVRAFSPVGFREFCDVLGGGNWEGVRHGRTVVAVGAPALYGDDDEEDPALDDPTGQRWLLLGPDGRARRALEALHLKLRVLAGAVDAVQQRVRRAQAPLLNLSDASFRVQVGAGGRALPAFWTARTVLIEPGDAVAPAIPGSDFPYYLPGAAAGAPSTVYQPPGVARPRGGRGAVRVLRVVPDEASGNDRLVVEGVFVTEERFEFTTSGVLWLRLSLGAAPLDLYAHIEARTARGAGESRFRTIGQGIALEQAAQLQAAGGAAFDDVPFEFLPRLSTPWDLYSLGVLAVRALLVNDDTSLPAALDEARRLARQAGAEHDPGAGLPVRIHALFEGDARFAQALGPDRLTRDPEDARGGVIPSSLWWETLAMIVRMFPGAGPDSTCQGYGDAQPGKLHKVFDRALADLDALLWRTRGLLLADWRQNDEIDDAIELTLRELEGELVPESGGAIG